MMVMRHTVTAHDSLYSFTLFSSSFFSSLQGYILTEACVLRTLLTTLE